MGGLQTQWPKDEAQVLEDLSLYGPKTNPDHEGFMMIAEIAMQLRLLGQQESGTDKLALETKPHKHLQVLQDIGKGKLMLVPTTFDRTLFLCELHRGGG